MTRLQMSSTALVILIGAASLGACDKEAGRKQETIGKVESAVGGVVGDKDLKAEGKSDKVAGQVKQGDLKGAVKDATQ